MYCIDVNTIQCCNKWLVNHHALTSYLYYKININSFIIIILKFVTSIPLTSRCTFHTYAPGFWIKLQHFICWSSHIVNTIMNLHPQLIQQFSCYWLTYNIISTTSSNYSLLFHKFLRYNIGSHSSTTIVFPILSSNLYRLLLTICIDSSTYILLTSTSSDIFVSTHLFTFCIESHGVDLLNNFAAMVAFRWRQHWI